jgi:uncharacterized protein YdeI (YjbR/CyaY-like superfamily)
MRGDEEDTMGKRDPRVDRYIENSAEFARPILTHLRTLVHTAVPEVEEEIKWQSPHFAYKGMFCSMSAFKAHCAFGFWKGPLVFDVPTQKEAMEQFGNLTSVKDLPSDRAMIALIKKAAKLNDDDVKVVAPKRAPKKPVDVPAYFTAAVKKNARAAQAFKAFSPTNQREYVEWVTDAKTESTRQKRLETAVAWMAEGKVRNWKYLPR